MATDHRLTAPCFQKDPLLRFVKIHLNMSSFTELDTFLDSEEASFGLTSRARQLVGVILEKAVMSSSFLSLTHLSRFLLFFKYEKRSLKSQAMKTMLTSTL
jgi:hypothetical protein